MVKLALVGCGYWGRNHLRTLREINEDSLYAVCDARRPNVNLPKNVKFLNDHKQILDDENYQGVVIATPTASHYVLAKDFLEAGKHVFVEKPLTTNSSQGEELCKIAEQKNVRLMVGEVFRFNPGIRFLKDFIGDGELGNLRYIESKRVGLGPIREDVSVLWDLATHDIYLANLLANGTPRSVSYQGISHNGKFDDVASINLKYPQGILATIYVNWEHPVKERRLVVGGTKKAVLFDDVAPSEKITIYESGVDYQPSSGDFGDFQASTRAGNIVLPRIEISQPLDTELRHFIACIKTGERCLSDGYEGLKTVKVLEAAEQSRKAGGLEIRLNG